VGSDAGGPGDKVNSLEQIVGMDLFALKSAGSPIPGTAASVGDCDDLEVSFCDPINYAVRKSPEEELPRAVQVHGPSLGTFFDFIDGMIELGHEATAAEGFRSEYHR
jgi:hypothetical protein